MTTIEEARARWLAERPAYAEFASEIERRLRNLVSEVGISAQVSARPKEVHSLVKKLIAKKHLSYESMPDKVGVRIIVRFRSELPMLRELICRRFYVARVEDTSERLKVDRVGYLGLHLDGLALLSEDSLFGRFPSASFFAELQLRTMSQHLWSEISHDSFYKNNEMLQELPVDLQRRVHLMAGQIEVADREFERMNSEIPSIPAAEIFKSLEPAYYSLAAERPNVELSMDVINALLPLYAGQEISVVSGHILSRFHESRDMFHHIYSSAGNLTTDVAAFLYQPEALMIYDCLLIDRDETVRQLNDRFPTEELERVAVLFGISLQ